MKGTTLKWMVVVGLVVAAVIAFVTSSKPAKPNFSARVVRFTLGDTNCIISITNKSGTSLECSITLGDGGLHSVGTRILPPHTFHNCSISVSEDPKTNRGIIIVGHQRVENIAWRNLLVRLGHPIGVHKLFVPEVYAVELTLTNTTDWVNAGGTFPDLSRF